MKRLIVPCLFVFALTACGGGGGGGASGGSSGGVTPPTQPSAVRSVPTQRAVATQSLASVSAVQSMYPYAAGGSVPLLSVRRAIDAAARRVTAGFAARGAAPAAARRLTTSTPSWGPCTNASETATTVVSATEELVYQRNFYDAACTQLKQDIALDINAASTSSVTATGTMSSFTSTGAQYDYETLQMSLTFSTTGALSSLSMQITDAVTPTSQQLSSVAFACGMAGTSATCGAGDVEHSTLLNADAGLTVGLSVSAGAPQGGLVPVPISLSVSGYTGALNALQLAPGTFPSWTISGGTLVDTASVSGQLAFTTAGALASGTLTFTDSADHASVSMTTSTTGTTASISDTATNAVVATFTVDPNGNGTIAYSDGTKGQIVNWQVQS